MKKIKLLATALLAIVALPFSSSAQVASFLNITPDAASQAMGGTSLVAPSSAFSLFNNVSLIALSEESFAVGASYNMWQVASVNNSIISAAAYYKLGDKFGIGASYSSIAKPMIEIYDDLGNYKSDFNPSDMSLGLGLSYAPVDNLSVGATLKLISSKLSDGISGSSVAFDFSVTYLLDDLSVSLGYSNLGSINYGDDLSYSLPSALKVGGSYEAMEVEDHSCRLNVQANVYTQESAFGVGAGGEYGFRDMLFARLGYYFSGDDSFAPSYLSLGLGAKYANLSLDLSYLIDDVLSPINISLGYRF